jgi:release factor glutamine methyltransferase
MKIQEAIAFGTDVLQYGLYINEDKDSVRQIQSDVNFLISGLIKKDYSFIRTNPLYELSKEEENTFKSWITRRLSLEPVQYITGETEFYGLEFYVGKGVLVPRQDTETLVDKVLEHFRNTKEELTFIDLCCGTGCIGISILKNFPNSKCIFIDQYEAPLCFTEKNIQRHGLNDRATIIKSDLFDSLDPDLKVNSIFCNPPYISPQELKSISLQITLFEPIEALKGGTDGLYYYRQVADSGQRFLYSRSPIFMEIGYNQARDVKNIFGSWDEVSVSNDLTGNPRVLKALRR